MRTDLATTDAAIARVLNAERAARAAIARARGEVQVMAEAARRDAAARAERAERRGRRIVACFDRATATRLDAIAASQAGLMHPPVLSAAEMAAIDDAVHRLAREMIGMA